MTTAFRFATASTEGGNDAKITLIPDVSGRKDDCQKKLPHLSILMSPTHLRKRH
jgi:hypothetical protein